MLSLLVEGATFKILPQCFCYSIAGLITSFRSDPLPIHNIAVVPMVFQTNFFYDCRPTIANKVNKISVFSKSTVFVKEISYIMTVSVVNFLSSKILQDYLKVSF